MGWSFRQSFKIIPGVKLNLSRSGLSASIGGAPFTLNVGPRGVYSTASIPGTGISFRQRLDGRVDTQSGPPEPRPSHIPDSPPSFAPDSSTNQEIRSASTEMLTSESLREFKRLIQTAYEEHEDIRRELANAEEERSRVSARYLSWENGFLLKRIFKKAFSIREAKAQIAAARTSELEEQLALTKIATQLDLAKEPADRFFRLRDEFAALTECAAIWDIKSRRTPDRIRERTSVDSSVTRARVKFSLGSCDLIQWDQEVPHLQNANGGDIFLYPGFILYRASKMAFSVLDFHDVKATTVGVKFQEAEGVPSDSKTVGQTWAKVNKDGSRDKRFADNRQIPIVHYGELTFKSDTGLWEVFHFSNPDRLGSFVRLWADFVASFDRHASVAVLPEPSQTGDELTNPSDDPNSSPPTAGTASSPRLVGDEVHFECSECGQPIATNSEAAGQDFHCPQCGEKLVVPSV